ncbi:MAG: hypothetical protein H5T86_05865, partial [Armatimonadetes bacterium]|nr:hypothetical protein [Armatimonadota bacterium]
MFSVPEPAEPPSPESLDFWSYYGACHVAEKLGRAGRGPGVLLDWAADAVRWIDCSCEVERQKVDGQPVGQGRPLRWEWQAAGAPGGQLAGMAGPWVVLGPLLPLAGACVLHAEVGGVTIALATLGPDKSVKFGWPIFAQIGLLLSRYSWSGVPGFQGFVRAVDPLWDKLIRPVCGQRPLVDELVELVRSAALMLAEKENAPLAELCPWPLSTNERPYDAALTFTHDVDAVYADERFRGRPAAEQRGNVWFNFMRWQELERGLGVKSAFYLMAPAGELR